MNKICIVGVGPGSKDYLTPIAYKRIVDSECLVGARRVLSTFRTLDRERIYFEGNFNKVISYLMANKDKKKIAVLVSGDPGMYSFLTKIKNNFKKKEYEVIPGISTMQIAFSKLGENWQDARIISLHARRIDNLENEIRSNEKVFLFTDPKFSPQKIAKYLLNNGIKGRRAIVFENITYPNERVIDTNLENLAKMKKFGICVMIIMSKKRTL